MSESNAGSPIAIVPARGGSRRIPRKNVKPFLGVPLIVRTLETLLESGIFDRVVVSTDDEEIAEVSISAGAEVPFLRPTELADDFTATQPVIAHAIRRLEADSGTRLGPVCCAYSAAVFVTSEMLLAGLEALCHEGVGKVISATSYPAPIQRAYRIAPNGNAEMLWPEHAASRSQDLEPTYHDAGQFYWAHRDRWCEEESNDTSSTRLLVLPRGRLHDIDDPEDWEVAETAYQILTARRPGDL